MTRRQFPLSCSYWFASTSGVANHRKISWEGMKFWHMTKRLINFLNNENLMIFLLSRKWMRPFWGLMTDQWHTCNVPLYTRDTTICLLYYVRINQKKSTEVCSHCVMSLAQQERAMKDAMSSHSPCPAAAQQSSCRPQPQSQINVTCRQRSPCLGLSTAQMPRLPGSVCSVLHPG